MKDPTFSTPDTDVSLIKFPVTRWSMRPFDTGDLIIAPISPNKITQQKLSKTKL